LHTDYFGLFIYIILDFLFIKFGAKLKNVFCKNKYFQIIFFWNANTAERIAIITALFLFTGLYSQYEFRIP